MIDDLVSNETNSSRSKDLEILRKILESKHHSLNYDGRQMYSQFYEELRKLELESPIWKSIYEQSLKPPSNTLLPIAKESPLVGSSAPSGTDNVDQPNINLIARLTENPHFVVSVSTEREEIAVWDLYR